MRLIREGARMDSDAGFVDQNRAVYRNMMILSARLHTILANRRAWNGGRLGKVEYSKTRDSPEFQVRLWVRPRARATQGPTKVSCVRLRCHSSRLHCC